MNDMKKVATLLFTAYGLWMAYVAFKKALNNLA